MKKILVIGIKGMAGHVVYDFLKKSQTYNVYGIARNIVESDSEFSLDVSDTRRLSEIVCSNNFDYVINCIGILNKDAEDNPSKAIWFNSYFPHFLEEITRDTACKVIHISTDCVFNGTRGSYSEEDTKDGVGFYAQSKALGEIINSKDLTIRTSIIGPELSNKGIGLFNWFMNQNEESQLKGYVKAYWSGITTIELAEVILAAIEQNMTGLINIAPKSKIDKYNLLLLFQEVFEKKVREIVADESYIVDKSLVSFRTDFSHELKDYKVMLLAMKSWMEERKELYKHYS